MKGNGVYLKDPASGAVREVIDYPAGHVVRLKSLGWVEVLDQGASVATPVTPVTEKSVTIKNKES
jgi:hypothetical protein